MGSASPILAVGLQIGGRHQQLGLVRILVVDDFEPWRRSVVSILEGDPNLEVVIREASDGLAAVQMCQELQPDLVLLDIGLPKLSGLEAARQIRVVSPDSKILFLTLISCQEMMFEALRLGAAGYITKEDALRDLLPAVRAAITDGDYLRFRILSEAGTDVPED
jgi:DNA-binding NarL/FixJ family response regulator